MFITAQEMVAMRQTLQEMKWPQQKYPLQTDNTSAAGVANNTIATRNSRQWTAASTGSDADNPKANFYTTGQLET